MPPEEQANANFASGMRTNLWTGEPRPCVYDAAVRPAGNQIQLFPDRQVEAWERGRAASRAAAVPDWANKYDFAAIRVYDKPVKNRSGQEEPVYMQDVNEVRDPAFVQKHRVQPDGTVESIGPSIVTEH